MLELMKRQSPWAILESRINRNIGSTLRNTLERKIPLVLFVTAGITFSKASTTGTRKDSHRARQYCLQLKMKRIRIRKSQKHNIMQNTWLKSRTGVVLPLKSRHLRCLQFWWTRCWLGLRARRKTTKWTQPLAASSPVAMDLIAFSGRGNSRLECHGIIWPHLTWAASWLLQQRNQG